MPKITNDGLTRSGHRATAPYFELRYGLQHLQTRPYC